MRDGCSQSSEACLDYKGQYDHNDNLPARLDEPVMSRFECARVLRAIMEQVFLESGTFL